MSKKKTHEEYVKEVASVNPNIEVIENYINSQTKIAHRCKMDGFIWNATPNNILGWRGCPKCKFNKVGAIRQKTHKEYVNDVSRINPNIEVIGNYINTKTSILHRCKIDGHEWLAKPNNILSGKGCPKCSGVLKKKHDEYVNEITIKNPNVKVIDNYINAKTKITHYCIEHDMYWKATPDNILGGKGCPKCKSEATRISHCKTHEQYIEELKLKNSNVIVLSQYINAITQILHKCLTHNVEWLTTPSDVLEGHGCPKCKSEKISKARIKTHDTYLVELKNINPDIEVIGEYTNSHTPILHRCKIDGYKWFSSPTNILSGCSCPQCSESNGERKVRQWLEKHNITYDFQKNFDDCRDKQVLPFDFYLPDYNAIIEYDGKQHFEPIEYFGGQESFEYTVKHDKIKNEYCKNNGISLLRIPYFKNVEEELNNFLFI